MSGLNLVKIVVEISKKFKGLEDDFLVAKFLHMQLVKVIHCQIEEALSIRTSDDHVDGMVKANLLKMRMMIFKMIFKMRMMRMMTMIGCEDGKWGEGLVWEEGQQWSELAVTCNTGGTHCNTVTRVATVKHCETHDMIMYAAANKAGYNVDDVVQYVWSCIYEQSIAGIVCKAW